MKRCPQCNRLYSDMTVSCPQCGIPLSGETASVNGNGYNNGQQDCRGSQQQDNGNATDGNDTDFAKIIGDCSTKIRKFFKSFMQE